MKIKVMLVEDEVTLANIVSDSLQTREFEVDTYIDGRKALNAFYNNFYHILVLDVMLPGMDGFTLAKEIRKSNPTIPIIFLTAKSQPEHVVKGFEMGGNDYLKKPFSMEELIVRIKNLLKVSENDKLITEKYELGAYTFHFDRQILEHNNTEQELTFREAEVLQMLCQNLNNIVERSIILNKLWGDDHFFNARSMDVFISRLRKHLKKDPRLKIMNIRGIGYKMVYRPLDIPAQEA